VQTDFTGLSRLELTRVDLDDGVVDMVELEHSSDNNSPTANDGIGFTWGLQDGTTNSKLIYEAAALDIVATDIGSASQDVDLNFYQRIAGVQTNTWSIDADGGFKINISPLVLTSNAATTEFQINNTAVDGDSYLSWALSGVRQFSFGVDDGDSDKLKLGTTAIGTGTILEVTTGGTLAKFLVPTEIENPVAGGAQALLVDNNDTNQIALDIEASNIDADIINIQAATLTSAKAIDISNLDALDTGKAIHVDATGNTQTTGILVHIDSASTVLTGVGRLLLVDSTGDFNDATGTVAEIQTVHTTGTGLALTMDAMTDGTGMFGTFDSLTLGIGVALTHATSVIADTGSLLRLTSSGINTGGATNGTVLDVVASAQAVGTVAKITSSGTTTGDVLDITVTGLTSGNGIIVNGGGANMIAGGALGRLDMGAATAGSGLEIVTSGVYAGTEGLLDISATLLQVGTALDIGDLDTLATGIGINVVSDSEIISSGELVTLALTSHGSFLTAKTGALMSISSSRTETAIAATPDNYDVLSITRTNITQVVGVLTADGSVARLENVATQTAGTLTDNVDVLEIVQDVNSTGFGIELQTGNTNAAHFDGTAATTQVQIDNSAVDGDPYIAFALSGTNQFSLGVDDGDSDKLKMGTTAIGTATIFEVPTGGGSFKTLVPTEIENPVAGGAAALTIDNDDTDEIALDIEADNIDANVVRIISNAITTSNIIDISSNSLQTGHVLNLSNDSAVVTSGGLVYSRMNIVGDSLANYSGNAHTFDLSRHEERTAGTTTDNGNAVYIRKMTRITGAGGTLDSSGAVLQLVNTVIPTAGTLNDTTPVLEIFQDADSTGPSIKASHSGTGNAVNIVLSAVAQAINIDADTTDHTAGNIIDVDLGVNSASINVINANIDISTILTAGEIVRGIYLDVNEAVVNETTSQIIGSEYQMTSFATSINDLIGFEVNFDGTKSATADVWGVHINSDSLTMNDASATYAGVFVDASGMTNTSSATAYGIHSLVGATADASIFASDGTQTVTLSDGTNSITANSAIVSSLNTDAVLPVPAAGTITAREYGDGAHHITVLTLTVARIGAVAGAALAIGTQIYELPAGVQFFQVSDINIAFDNDDTSCDADDPVYGIGSVVGAGAAAVLNGTATFMDYHTEQTSTNCDGTVGAVSGPLAVTAGIGTGIALNAAGSTKTIFFNCAETWTGTTNITATGTITLVWDTLR